MNIIKILMSVVCIALTCIFLYRNNLLATTLKYHRSESETLGRGLDELHASIKEEEE